jgi:hypothetical protein
MIEQRLAPDPARHLLRIDTRIARQIAVIAITTRAIFFVTLRQTFVR